MAFPSQISRNRRTALICAAVGLLLTGTGQADDAIVTEIGILRDTGRLSYANIRIADPTLIAEFYGRRSFSAAWDDRADVASVAGVIRTSVQDGLRPADYHLQRIEATQRSLDEGRRLTERGRAAFDILLTDAMARLVRDLHFGKASESQGPSAPADGADGHDQLATLEGLVAAGSLSAAIHEALPRSRQYLRLRAALNRYQLIHGSGGWPVIADGPTIAAGERDNRLGVIAERLAMTGDLPEGTGPHAWYTGELEAAVRRFQARHGLEADGEIGPATLRAMNVPVETRIDQLRVNLERSRWNAPTEKDDLVRVNVPAFRADLIRDGSVIWSTRVIVGEPEAETPELCSEIRYVVLNPTWTVPYSIASEELLPDIQADSGFLSRGGYEVFAPGGDPVDPAGIDWAALNANNFPFTLVQQPGPVNQLGQIKFVFPNPYSVYMHDTNARRLFASPRRALSHGCIRVDRPLDLAQQLLSAEGWTRQSIEVQIESSETRTVFLATPMPVTVRYLTAEVDDRGVIHFHADIYDRDGAVLTALDAPAL